MANQKLHLKFVNSYCAHGADSNVLDDSTNQTALLTEAQKGAIDICQLLLSNGADPNVKGGIRKDTPLHNALYYTGEPKVALNMCQLLLRNGGDPNVKDYANLTALYVVAMKGRLDICELLVNNGADSNATCGSYSITASHIAALEGRRDNCEFLWNNGFDGKTSLHFAAGKEYSFELYLKEANLMKIFFTSGRGKNLGIFLI
ncbi:poly [ADP-ribose] polymerase tankyrase-2-like [Artemia franciscana]|uniref:poly [ADP-ribose] polymerase tankyrase-2-like n=1 Tax=Artemia franciscana TaxID=6661 RepID=UPI0032D9FC8A